MESLPKQKIGFIGGGNKHIRVSFSTFKKFTYNNLGPGWIPYTYKILGPGWIPYVAILAYFPFLNYNF